jgi:hypothetical protein
MNKKNKQRNRIDAVFQRKIGIFRSMNYPKYILKATDEIKIVRKDIREKKFLARLFLKHLILRTPKKLPKYIKRKFI